MKPASINTIEYYKNPLEKIPIHKKLLEDKRCANSFESVVDKIIEIKKLDTEADISELEKEIDSLVYSLYGLTPDQISLIENSR